MTAAFTRPGERDDVLRVLANGVLVALLFPYLSPIPMGSDVQPFGFAVAIIALALLFLMRGHVEQLDLRDLLLLGGGYLFAFYADWRVQELDLLFVRKHAVLLIAFPAYLAVKQLYPYMARRVVLAVALAYLAVTLVQGLAPGAYEGLASVMLPRVAARSAERGLSGPTPEPSFLAFVAIGLPIVYLTIPRRPATGVRRGERWEFRVLLGVCVALILLARSVTGTLLGVMLLGVVWLVSLRTWRARLLLAGGALAAMGMGVAWGEQVLGARIYNLMRVVATKPSLVLLDASIAARYVQIVGGAYVAVTHPIGTGRSVGDPAVFDMAGRALGFDRHVPARSMRYIESNRTDAGNIAVLSPVGDSLARMGLVFLALLGVLLAMLRHPGTSTASRVYLAFGIISSFPLAFTLFWLLFGMHAGSSRLARSLPVASPSPAPVGS